MYKEKKKVVLSKYKALSRAKSEVILNFSLNILQEVILKLQLHLAVSLKKEGLTLEVLWIICYSVYIYVIC